MAAWQRWRRCIAHYERGGRRIDDGPFAGDGRLSPYKSEFVLGFELSPAERADLLAFLEALTDESVLIESAMVRPVHRKMQPSP